MNKILILCGATAIALGVASESAEAKKVFYDINGERFSYESNDPQQAESARKRIDAANAAYATRTKADTERAATPLVGIFGSHAQSEAAQAQEQLEQVMAEQGEADAARKQEWSSAKGGQRRKQAGKQARQPDAPDAKSQAAAPEQQPANSTSLETADEAATSNKQKPIVKSVSFDVTSGIKTTIMTDGAVQEEPFDSNMLAKLAFEQGSSGSLTEFVNQLREASPQDATGSTTAGANSASNNSSPAKQN
ncbi:hypothetical protein [Microvirga alba]|uniref:Uncharacterized protein n=1 Tax=Microvirga alba TaxID=2791025 RepID=A0A931FND9_9HYPH|nr:hypothetical protein [Microvirga alba]MBF9232222.1 hypothetical protein [Microvirga alba]